MVCACMHTWLVALACRQGQTIFARSLHAREEGSTKTMEVVANRCLPTDYLKIVKCLDGSL